MAWDYAEQATLVFPDIVQSSQCVYCGSAVEKRDEVSHQHPWGDSEHFELRTCLVCGWWKVFRRQEIYEGSLYRGFRDAAAGSIRKLESPNLAEPMNAVRAVLTAKREQGRAFAPQLAEDAIRGSFGEHGFDVLARGATGDHGLAVLLSGADGMVVGVHVDVHDDSIMVSQLQELIGALVVDQATRGVFVTSSRPPASSAGTDATSRERRYTVELVESSAFLESVGIEQRTSSLIDDFRNRLDQLEFTRVADTGTRHAGLYRFMEPYGQAQLPYARDDDD